MVDDLNAKILIGNDIISLEKIVIDITRKSAYINNYNVTININSGRRGEYIRRRIYSKYAVVVLLYSEVMVPISPTYLLDNRDFLFELIR